MYQNSENLKNLKNMGDYHKRYLKRDVLLLADVLEKFTDMCLKFYKFDPSHYFSSSGLSWNVMLKMTGIKFIKFQTLTCTYLLKKGLKGGFSKANNKGIKNHDPTKLSKHVMCLEENNLYGWEMNGYLPYGGFMWLKIVMKILM